MQGYIINIVSSFIFTIIMYGAKQWYINYSNRKKANLKTSVHLDLLYLVDRDRRVNKIIKSFWSLFKWCCFTILMILLVFYVTYNISIKSSETFLVFSCITGLLVGMLIGSIFAEVQLLEQLVNLNHKKLSKKIFKYLKKCNKDISEIEHTSIQNIVKILEENKEIYNLYPRQLDLYKDELQEINQNMLCIITGKRIFID